MVAARTYQRGADRRGSPGQANRDVVRLAAFRLSAIGVSPTKWPGAKDAYKMLGEGHVSVHGSVDKVVVNTVRGVSQTNGAQNTGSAGSMMTGEDPEPGPIVLPL